MSKKKMIPLIPLELFGDLFFYIRSKPASSLHPNLVIKTLRTNPGLLAGELSLTFPPAAVYHQ